MLVTLFLPRTLIQLHRSLLAGVTRPLNDWDECRQGDPLFDVWFNQHGSPADSKQLATAILSEPTPVQLANQNQSATQEADEPSDHSSYGSNNDSSNNDSADEGHICWADLVDLASLVLRSSLLEESFDKALHRRHQRILYNFAYGLSHELNNPLASIATRAGVLLQTSQGNEQQELLQAIVDNAMRGHEMLGDLMLIARPPRLELKVCSTEDLLAELAKKSKPYLHANAIELHCNDQQHTELLLDRTAILEALWAVLRNALEAMPSGGLLQMSSACNDQWDFWIADEGVGLTEEALASAFDPFYSGREAGRGLGVGLAKARRIIELHGGEIELANRPTTGCACRIRLPRDHAAG